VSDRIFDGVNVKSSWFVAPGGQYFEAGEEVMKRDVTYTATTVSVPPWIRD
jgi:hypothetical protein